MLNAYTTCNIVFSSMFSMFFSPVFSVAVNVAWSMYPVERGPTFVLEPPSSMEFSSDTGAVVPCSAQGQPSPQVRWEKRDGTPAGPIAGVRDIRPDGSLLFHQFKVTQFRPDVHATAYRCVAYNHVGLIKSRLVQIKGGQYLFRLFHS